MAVPYTFGTATASIPLSNLDSNFATTITLGNTAIQLGNTVTTLNNMTLANVTVSSGSVTLTNIAVTTANVTTANIGTAVITGTSTLTGLTASTALALDASKNIVSVTNTGSGNNVLGTSPTIATPTISTITSAASTALTLQSNNGNTAVTVDTIGNMGIGTTSPSYRVDAVGAGSPANGIMRTSSNLTNSTTKYGYYTVGHYTNATVPFGFIQGESNSTENNVHIGGGAGEVTAATRIDFYTAANNTTTNGTERMRIDSSGNVLVGTTSTSLGSIGCQMFPTGYYQATCNGAPAMILKRGSSDGAIVDFYDSGNNRRGYINVTTSATTYNTISDYRLKEDVAPMTGALAKVAALKPVTYKWKADGSYGQGFIAHELQSVVPDCVVGEKDAVDENGDPSYQGIDTSFLVATLTAAIQEQQALITSLTARIVALEAK